jgi:hypothetical protein
MCTVIADTLSNSWKIWTTFIKPEEFLDNRIDVKKYTKIFIPHISELD